jgi:hypothetical protein
MIFMSSVGMLCYVLIVFLPVRFSVLQGIGGMAVVSVWCVKFGMAVFGALGCFCGKEAPCAHALLLLCVLLRPALRLSIVRISFSLPASGYWCYRGKEDAFFLSCLLFCRLRFASALTARACLKAAVRWSLFRCLCGFASSLRVLCTLGRLVCICF